MELLTARDTAVPFKAACDVLGLPRASARRHSAPKVFGPRRPRPPSMRRITPSERHEILDVLHSERSIDQTPHQVYAGLLDEQKYIASPSTMYRVFASECETKGCRNQRIARSYAVPRLEATAPNQVWTLDISKLATHESGTFFNLYLVLDLFSRFPTAWMVAERENTALSKQIFAEAMSRQRIAPGSITVHNDRCAPLTSNGFVGLLSDLGAATSKSRPRVSNDNPFSESCFKTIKQQPDYPGRFHDIAHARQWFETFFEWYANQHRHSGLAFFTPADTFHGRVAELAQTRQRAFNAAYTPHPERFVAGCTKVRLPSSKVSINPIDPGPDAPNSDIVVFAIPGTAIRDTNEHKPS